MTERTDAPILLRLAYQAMLKAGLPVDAIGTPIIEVNGTLLPNNPDLDEIARHLTRTSKG